MPTTRPGAPRTSGSPQVVPLRPRLMARRAAGLQRRLDARLTTGAQPHQRPLQIIADVLARAGRVPADDHDSWERFLHLLEEHEDSSYAIPVCAATANLLGLALFGESDDHAALADLAATLGHERLARIQHRYGTSVESDARLPLTTDAVRGMLLPHLRDQLAADPEAQGRVDAIDDACLRAAHALLVQGVDRGWTVPALDTVEELIDIARFGTVVEWRHHLAMVVADVWSPYTVRVVELAQMTGSSHTASVVAAVVDLCREQAAGPPRVERPGRLRRPLERLAVRGRRPMRLGGATA